MNLVTMILVLMNLVSINLVLMNCHVDVTAHCQNLGGLHQGPRFITLGFELNYNWHKKSINNS